MRWKLHDQDLGLKSEGLPQTDVSPEGERHSAAGRGCTPKLIRSNKALMCLEAGRECRQGSEWGLVTAGRHSPEQPLSPPQGQHWPQ